MKRTQWRLASLFGLVGLAGWLLVWLSPDRPRPISDPEPEVPLEAPLVSARPSGASDAGVRPPPAAPAATTPVTQHGAASTGDNAQAVVPLPVTDIADMSRPERRKQMRALMVIPNHLLSATDAMQRRHFEILYEHQHRLMDQAREHLAELARQDQRDPEVERQREQTFQQLEISEDTAEVLKERLARWPDW